MRLITTKRIRVGDASQPLGPDGFFPDAILEPGQYALEEIPNPDLAPGEAPGEFQHATWIVVRGTKLGMARGGWHHDFIHHRDPGVLLSI